MPHQFRETNQFLEHIMDVAMLGRLRRSHDGREKLRGLDAVFLRWLRVCLAHVVDHIRMGRACCVELAAASATVSIAYLRARSVVGAFRCD